jgi:group I intron endonuclease
VGSSANLGYRFSRYFSFNYISYPKVNMLINKALIKYGYANFSLEILEYCDPALVISREQYYMDLLKPVYNMAKIAGSPLGYKHTAESRAKMGGIRSAAHAPPENLRSAALKFHSNGDGFYPEVRAIISQGVVNFNIRTKGKKVVFTNLETQEIFIFVSIRDAALKMKLDRRTINKYILSQEPLGKYKISFLQSNGDGVTFVDKATGAPMQPLGETINLKIPAKKVVFTNLETQEILTFPSIRDAALNMNIDRRTINKYILSQKPYGKYKISYG